MKTTLKFYTSQQKADSNGKFPLYIRVLNKRGKAEGRINIPSFSEKIAALFDPIHFRFPKEYSYLNDVISKIELDFHDFLRENGDNIINFSPRQIRDSLLKRDVVEKQSLIKIMDEFQQQVYQDINKSYGTKKHYKKSLKHFRKFLAYTNKEYIYADQFTSGDAENFVTYLISELPELNKQALIKASANSVVKNIKPLFKKLYNNRIIDRDPFSELKVRFPSPDIDRMAERQFLLIKNHEFNNPMLDCYRDIFIFMCYTGLGYADLYSIKRSEFVKDYFLDGKRVKTNTRVRQIVVKQAKELVDKYENDLSVLLHNTVMPFRSLSKINKNLKTIAEQTGVDLVLTSYMARRFFRQTIANAEVHEPLVVKSLMGHSAKGMMDQHYLIVTNKMLLKAKNKLENYFNELDPSVITSNELYTAIEQ